jgi:hypothetical protein
MTSATVAIRIVEQIETEAPAPIPLLKHRHLFRRGTYSAEQPKPKHPHLFRLFRYGHSMTCHTPG